MNAESRVALASRLQALADKAVQRVMTGAGMTELLPDDVRLLQDAAKSLALQERLAIKAEDLTVALRWFGTPFNTEVDRAVTHLRKELRTFRGEA